MTQSSTSYTHRQRHLDCCVNQPSPYSIGFLHPFSPSPPLTLSQYRRSWHSQSKALTSQQPALASLLMTSRAWTSTVTSATIFKRRSFDKFPRMASEYWLSMDTWVSQCKYSLLKERRTQTQHKLILRIRSSRSNLATVTPNILGKHQLGRVM